MNLIDDILNSIQTYYQFIAFIVIVTLLIIKWFAIDNKKDKILANTSATVDSVVKMLKGQNELLKILIRRYSDDLSQEQLSPFINWMLQSFEFNFYIKYIRISRKLENHTISDQEAKIQLKQEIENISNEFQHWLSLFKYKGTPICDYWSKESIDYFYDASALELSRRSDVERTIDLFDRIIRKQIIDMVDKIQKNEGVTSG